MRFKTAVGRFVPVAEILRLMDRRSKLKLLALAVSSIITGLLQAAVLVIIVQVGVALADTSEDVTGQLGPFGSFDFSVGQLLALSLGSIVVVMVLDVLNAHMAASLAAGVGLRIRSDFIDSYVHTSWPEHTRIRDGELHELGVVAPNHATAMVQAMATGLIAVGNFSAMLLTAFAVNAAAAAGVVVVVLFLLLIMQPMARVRQRMTKRTQRLNIAYGGRLIDTQSMSQEIAVYGVRDEVQAELDRDNSELSRVRYKMNLLQRLSSAMFRHVGLIFVLGVIAMAYSLQVSELGSLGAVFLILLRALGYGQAAQTAQHQLRAEQPWPIVVRDAIARFDRSRPASGDERVDRLQRLTFDDVSFAYGDAEVLHHVSFEVKAGEVVGIVGPSGAGKSTLVQLLLRLRLQDSGSFLLDGTPVEAIDLDSFYRRVAFVSQSPQTIRGSLEDNVRFRREWVSAGMVTEAVRDANLTTDVEAMDDGMATFVGERGGNISGGQRQRLALARALAGHPDLLILDEPTSALDPHSEQMIKETIEGLKGSVTMFIVAHRFSTLGVCDRIMVLEDGHLTGFDTPESLLTTNEFFSQASAIQQL